MKHEDELKVNRASVNSRTISNNLGIMSSKEGSEEEKKLEEFMVKLLKIKCKLQIHEFRNFNKPETQETLRISCLSTT